MHITINDTLIKLTEYDCSILFVDVGDKTQTIDGVDHYEKKKRKRYITAKTTSLYPEVASFLMNILNNQTLTVKYDDPITNTEETRVFSLQNNPAFKKALWKTNIQFYEGINIELQEKGAE